MGKEVLEISLKAARVNKGLTQKELAAELDRNVQTIANWENGKNSMKINDYLKVKEILELPENIFLKI